MGEDSTPAVSGAEYARRTQFINEAIRSIVRKHYWWWTETSTTFDSVSNQSNYSSSDPGYPTNIRGSSLLELRFNGTLYTPILQSEVFDLEGSNTGYANRYYFFQKKLWPSPAFSSTVVGGVAMKYYKIPSELSSGSDTIDIPDEFSDVVVAFSLGRVYAIDSERGSAADAYDEFKEIYAEMEQEQNNYLFALKQDAQETAALYE
jgi:hypothetical protein